MTDGSLDSGDAGSENIVLDDAQRQRLIGLLCNAGADEIAARQKEVTETAIRYMQSVRSNKKAEFCRRYGARVGFQPKKNGCLQGYNYCVAIQSLGFKTASKEFGDTYSRELNQEMRDLCFFSHKAPAYVCQGDSTKTNISCWNTMENMREVVSGNTSTTTASDYVNRDGTVKKDQNGKPLLEDGDLIFVRVGAATNTSSGWHCVRANVAKDGKVTTSAGNGEHIEQNVFKTCSVKQVKVVHSKEYMRKACAYRFQNVSNEELLELAKNRYPEIYRQVTGAEAAENQPVNPETARADVKRTMQSDAATAENVAAAAKQQLKGTNTAEAATGEKAKVSSTEPRQEPASAGSTGYAVAQPVNQAALQYRAQLGR